MRREDRRLHRDRARCRGPAAHQRAGRCAGQGGKPRHAATWSARAKRSTWWSPILIATSVRMALSFRFDEQTLAAKSGPRLPARWCSSPRFRSALAPSAICSPRVSTPPKPTRSKYSSPSLSRWRGFLRIHIPSSPEAFVSQPLVYRSCRRAPCSRCRALSMSRSRRRSSLICRVPAPMPLSARWSAHQSQRRLQQSAGEGGVGGVRGPAAVMVSYGARGQRRDPRSRSAKHVMVADKPVPAGTCALFSIPTATSFTVIPNKNPEPGRVRISTADPISFGFSPQPQLTGPRAPDLPV